MKSYLKFKKIQCFSESCDWALIQSAGHYRLITGLLNQGVIAQLTTTCTDSKNLGLHFQARSVRPLDYLPHTVTIDFEAELLYPDLAFGSLGSDGLIYERVNREEIILHVYSGGKDLVLEMQKEYLSGGELEDLNCEPEQWNDEENITTYFVDCAIR